MKIYLNSILYKQTPKATFLTQKTLQAHFVCNSGILEFVKYFISVQYNMLSGNVQDIK